MKERIIGLVLVICGGVLAYLCIYLPVESARTGAPTVMVSIKGAILAPIGLVGLIYLVMGQDATTIMGTRENPSAAAWGIGIGAILLGIVIYTVIRSTLEGYGYDFQGRW